MNPPWLWPAFAEKLKAEAHNAFVADMMSEVHDPVRQIDGTWALRVAFEPVANNQRRNDYAIRLLWHRSRLAVDSLRAAGKVFAEYVAKVRP